MPGENRPPSSGGTRSVQASAGGGEGFSLHEEGRPRRPRAHRRAAITARDWAEVGRRLVPTLTDSTPPRALSEGDRVPVVLVPGIWEHWRFLLPLARRLHGFGHPVHPLPSLGWNARGVEGSVRRALSDLRSCGIGEAVLVAHSKGGLIGKRLLLDPAVSSRSEGGPGPRYPRLHGLVALCSPFMGSSLAGRAVAGTTLGMFRPSGALIRSLGVQRAADSRIVSIGSAWDEMIPQGSQLPGGRNLTVAVPGHFLLLRDPRTAELVHRSIEELAAAR